MLTDLSANLSVALFGAALGWTCLFSGVVAPVAYKDLDYGRAHRHVGRVIKLGHGPLAGVCFLGAGLAVLGGSIGAASLAGVIGVVLLMCIWTLAPRNDNARMAGGRRKLKTARSLASGLTAAMAPLLLIAVGLAAARV